METENPFIRIGGKKKAKKTDMSIVPTNSSAPTNSNAMNEAKKKYGPYSASEKEGKVMRSAARSLAAISGRHVPNEWEKDRPLHADPIVAKGMARRANDQKIDQYKQDARNYVRRPTDGNRSFRMHPDTVKALAGTSAPAAKNAVNLAKRLRTRSAAKAAAPTVNKIEQKPTIVTFPDTSSLTGGKPRNLNAIYDHFQKTGQINRVEAMAAAAAQHSQDMYHARRASDYRRVQQPHYSERHHAQQDRLDAAETHDIYKSHVARINDIFKTHQKQFNLAKPAIEIGPRGFVPDTTPDSLTVHDKPITKKAGMLGRLKKKIFGEDKNYNRLEKIKSIVEARNQFRAAGAGGARGGGVIHKGTRGTRKSPVTMQKKAVSQVAQGVKKSGMGQKQAAAIAIAKQKASGNLQAARQKNSQYRVN